MATKDFMNLMKAKTTDLKPSLLSAEENIKSQIVVLDQFVDLIPPLTDEESNQLEQNLLTHGVKDPLTIWETTSTVAGLDDDDRPTYILIDGHNRYRFSQKHKLDFRINLIRFSSIDEVQAYMIDYQLGRRNLTSEQISYLRGKRYLQYKGVRGGNLLAEGPQINVSETLAKEYGVSSRTIKRDGEFAAGIEKLSPELKHAVLGGKQKIPKYTIKAIAKNDDLQTSVEDIASQALALPTGHKTDDVTLIDKIKSAEVEIRNLANSRLTNRSCKQLIKKVNELLSLHSSK